MNNRLLHIFKTLLIVISALIAIPARAQINTDQVLRVGQNALYFEDYMLSIQYFNRVIEAKPYLAKPYLFRAIAKLNLDDYIGAEEDATKAIELNPFLTDSYEVRGVARQNRGDYAGAIADYDAALVYMPDNRGMLFNKALAQEETGDKQGALTTFNHIVEVAPGYDNAYMGRAKVLLELADTVAAKADLDHALSLNKNLANAYVLRANISMSHSKDYTGALDDMNEAIRLQPRYAGLFINRAFLRYHLDDYFGAMADYDYAITLDPTNAVAYFNRGLLRAQVADNDKAIADFSMVLKLNPDDMMSRYNRSQLYMNSGNYKQAIDDINKVIERYPEMSAPRFMRFEIYDRMGDRRNAMRDYDAAIALSKKEYVDMASNTDADSSKTSTSNKSEAADDTKENIDATNTDNETSQTSQQLFANRFSALLTIENEVETPHEYNNKSIRGKVQDRDVAIELEPDFAITYYSSPTELSPSTYYMQEIDQINNSRALRMLLQITNAEPPLDDEETINHHFASIEYFNSYISTHTPRAIDYFGRGMDHLILHNNDAAIDDFSRAITMAPDFALAYFARAIALTRQLKSLNENIDDEMGRMAMQARLRRIIDDYNTVIEYSPLSPFPHFNLGNLYASVDDLTSALSAYSRAIELKEDFGEAYYNRGYIYFRLGNRQAGSDDLSRAGQLGIIPSYNLLKRMTR